MENQYEKYQHLITRVLSREATPEEQKALQLWLDSSQKNRDLFVQYEMVWGLEPSDVDDVVFGKPQAWKNIQKKILIEETSAENASKHITPKRKFIQLITTLAAMVLLAFGLFHFLKDAPEPIYQSLLIEKGFTKSLQLSDGSTINLKGPALLEYPTEFNGSERKVHLSGEAFFEVNHRAEQSFIIEVEGANIIVLGTDFYLSAHPESDLVEVAVLEGSVMLKSIHEAHGEVVLATKQQAVYHKEKGRIQRDEITDLNFLAWHSGLLTFNETPLSQVFSTLESTFNIMVDVQVDLNGLKLTARFQDEEVQDIFQTLGILFNLQIEHHENQFYIN